MNAAAPVLVLLTGGTIAAEAYPDPQHPPEKAILQHNDRVRIALERVAKELSVQLSIRDLCAKDSKMLTEDDIDEWAEEIADYAEAATDPVSILITHGTDRMVDHAIALDRHALISNLRQKDRPVTIAFTGAWAPLTNGGIFMTDAEANLRTALHGLSKCGLRTFIAMDGLYYDPYNTVKDFAAQQFRQENEATQTQQPNRRRSE